jgi:hypothetical protein
MQRYLLPLLCFTTLLLAQSPYLPPNAPRLPKIILEASVCNSDQSFCLEKKLSTYDAAESSFPAELEAFRPLFAHEVSSYYDDNISEELLSSLKDIPDISGDYYRHSDITLFAMTPETLTLAHEISSYEGGTHGSDEMIYENFLRSNATPLTIDRLFKPNSDKKLLTIAEHYYRLTYNIPDHKNMQYDGWFNPSFVLADNFAITPNGLLFLYNPYEIKPYADGMTSFMLPYSAIKSLIDPYGPLRFTKKLSTTRQHYTFQEGPITLTMDLKRQNDFLDINVSMQSDMCIRSGNWLSLSFPQLKNQKWLHKTAQTRFKKLTVYDTHRKIYNRRLQKNIPAQYLLVEAEQPSMCIDGKHKVSVRIKVPKQISTFIIDLRALSKTKESVYIAPYDYDGTLGQQGYQNYRVLLDM